MAEEVNIIIQEGGSGTGDMNTSTYDPTSVFGDAFDMDNMVEGADTKILTAAERTKLSNTSGTNTGDQDISGITTNATNLSNHIADVSNPHSVTKAQVGLSNVDNTSDADKPISTATQTALDSKLDTANSFVEVNTDIDLTGRYVFGIKAGINGGRFFFGISTVSTPINDSQITEILYL